MINNPTIFYLAFGILTIFALISLFAKNVIYSLLAAIVVFFAGALFFYILGSEYNAIIQAAIYGFAVPVLIGLSVMFVKTDDTNKKINIIPYLTAVCAGIFLLAFIVLPSEFNVLEFVQTNSFDTIKAFAKGIFGDYVWAFELVSLLLTIIIAGFGLLVRKEKTWK